MTWTSGEDHVLLATATGQAIRFTEDDVRAMGRNASGVKGINLSSGDHVIGLVHCTKDDPADLLTVTENGYGKRTPLGEYLVHSEDGTSRAQGRGGKGRRDIATTARNGKAVSTLKITPDDDLMLISQNGMIVRIRAESIRQTGRAAQGVRVINLNEGDTLAAVARIAEDGNGDETDNGE